MCARFELNSPARIVAARFGLRAPLPNLPGPVVRPTDPALAITAAGPRILHFGLRTSWQKPPLINARSETIGERSTFRHLLGRRCLVPASAWIEWQAVGARRKKPMWRLKPAEDGPFALAGLVQDEQFVILTCAPAPSIAFVHDRMPVVLPPELEQAWIDPAVPFDQLAPALGPCRQALQATPAMTEDLQQMLPL